MSDSHPSNSATETMRVKSIGIWRPFWRLWVFAAALLVLAAGLYFARRSGSDYKVYSNDFNVYYFAAREIIAGHDPYTVSLGPSMTYLYPPLLAELMTPLALLPLPLAAYVWFLASATSWAAAAVICTKLARDGGPEKESGPDRSRYLSVAALGVLVLLRFTLDTFDMGQVNAIVVFLAAVHLYLFTRGRSVWSAIALALASAIKLTPALLVLYHFTKGRTKFAVLCSVLIATVTLGSFFALGPSANGAVEQFWSRTIRNQQGFDLTYSGNQSLRGALGRIVGESGEAAQSPSTPIALIATIIVLLLSIFISRGSVTEMRASAPFFCCMVLISPLAWKNHYVMFLVPIAYLACTAVTPSEPPPARLVSRCALVLMFLLFNFTSPKLIGLQDAEWADTHSLVAIGGLVALVGLGALSFLGRTTRESNAN